MNLPSLWKYRPPRLRSLPGIAALVLRKFKSGPILRDALVELGYQCPRCPRLLASGARCPSHPRANLGSNSKIVWVLHNLKVLAKAA